MRLVAARNEIVAFQVIVEADAGGRRARSRASLPELRRRGGTETIAYAPPAPDPTPLRRPADPALLRPLHERHRGEPRRLGLEAGKPRRAARHRRAGSRCSSCPRTRARGRGGFPLAVGPRLGQALWVEIYVGRDRPAGVYEGTLTITADGKATRPAGRAARLRLRPPRREQPPGDGLLRARPARALPGPEPRPGVPPLRPPPPRRARARVRRGEGRGAPRPVRRERLHGGRAATRGPARASATRSSPRPSTAPARRSRSKESAWTHSDAWMSFLARSLPEGHHLPLPARRALPAAVPGGEAPRARTCARTSGPGRSCRLFLTKRIIPEFQGLVDIWSIPPQAFDIAAAAAERAQGRRVSFYNGGRPQGPTPVIDAPATEARAVAWAAFKHDVDLYFYWHGVHWQHNRQKQGERKPERVGEPDHVRQPGPAPQARRGPGLDQRRRRPALPRARRCSTPRRTAASPVPSARSSSRTSAADCRTTST